MEITSKSHFDVVSLLKDLGIAQNPMQVAICQSTARHVLFRGARRTGKSKAGAERVLRKVMLPKTRGWIVGPCVDETTEILTMRGWLSYQQLQIGELVLTLNDKGLAEWQPCQRINTFLGTHEMVHIQLRGHDSLTTPNHRWLVGYTGSIPSQPKARKILGYRFVTTETMTKPNEFVLCGAPVLNLPSVSVYSDGLVELIGWYWTEGSDQEKGSGVLITQNAGPKADRIRNAATAVFGVPSLTAQMRNSHDPAPRWSDWKPISKQPTCGRFGFNSRAGRLLRELAPDKVMTPQFLCALTHPQLELLIDASVQADGHQRIRHKRVDYLCREVVQKRKDRLDALQMACQLAGLQTRLAYFRSRNIWTLQIFERKRIWLGQRPQLKQRRMISYVGTVWCPTTPNGTWLARRNGTVYFTGNSYELAHKEFRYIREFVQAFCRMAKLPAPQPIRENPGAGDLYLLTPWGSEVIGKSAQKPETLVGEELDWVLMSEPALHKRETWERYLRPTLSTRTGESVWPYTPDSGGLWLYELELEASQRPGWEVFHQAAWDCPHYDPQEIAAAKRELSEDAFAEQYGGEWRFYTGRVYRSFQADTHLVPAFTIPQGWKVYAGTDFGLRDATCTLWMAKSPTGEGYFFDEYYYTNQDRATPDHAVAMLAKEAQRGIRPLVRVADHHGLGAQLILDAAKAGWKTIGVTSQDRRSRRDRTLTAVARKPRPAPYHVREIGGLADPEGRYPDLFVMKGRCPNLVRELQFLRWRDTARKEGGFGDTEGDDHAVDTMEYIIEYAGVGAVSRHRTNKRQSQSTYKPLFAATGY